MNKQKVNAEGVEVKSLKGSKLKQDNPIWNHHERNLLEGKEVKNEDGSVSTVKTIILGDDQFEYLIPTVWDGEILDEQSAWKRAMESGIDWPKAPAGEEGVKILEELDTLIHKDMKPNLTVYANGGIVNQPNVNAEGGEVIQFPNGNAAQLKGPSHEDGGIDLQVPNGSIIYSDTLAIKDKKGNFKTLSERKKDRDVKLNKLAKLLDKDKSVITKNTVNRLRKELNKEELSDLAYQDSYNRTNKTGEYSDTIKAETGMGTPWGSILSVGSSLLGAANQMSTIKEGYKNRPELPNVYQQYGLNSLNELNNLKSNIEQEKAIGLNVLEDKLQSKEQENTAQIQSMGGTINLQRALRSASKRSSDEAIAAGITNLESDYINKLSGISEKKANVLSTRDELLAKGEAARYADKLAAFDQYYADKTAAIADVSSMLSGVGSQMTKLDYYKQLRPDTTNDFLDDNLDTK